MKKKLGNILIILCLVAGLFIGAGGREQETEKKRIYIGVACYDQKDTYLGELIEAFKTDAVSIKNRDTI